MGQDLIEEKTDWAMQNPWLIRVVSWTHQVERIILCSPVSIQPTTARHDYGSLSRSVVEDEDRLDAVQ